MSNETPSNTEQVRTEILEKREKFSNELFGLGNKAFDVVSARNNPDITAKEQVGQAREIIEEISVFLKNLNEYINQHRDFLLSHTDLLKDFSSLKPNAANLVSMLNDLIIASDVLEKSQNKLKSFNQERDGQKKIPPSEDGAGSESSGDSGSQGGQEGPPNQEDGQVERQHPFMGKFDTAKRFLLSEQVNLFQYEQVKDWGRQEIVSALSLYLDMWISENMHPEKPFDAMRLMDTPVQIRKSDGEVLEVSVRKALMDLGAETSRIFEYRLGAVEKVLAQGAEFSEVRNQQDMSAIVRTATMEKGVFQGLFDVEDEGGSRIEIRPYGVAVTEAEMLRLVLASMHKRLFNGKKQMFKHESGKRIEMIAAWQEIRQGLVGLLKEVNSQKEEGFWLDQQEKEVSTNEDRLKRIADAAIIKAYNLGDLLFFRVMHDVKASRFDILLPSLWAQLRRAQEKYFDVRRKKGEGNVEVGGILGKLKGQETSHIAFWEGIWQPLVVREHALVHYLVKDENGGVKVKADLMNLEAALRLNVDLKVDGPQTGKIPDRSIFSKEERKILVKLYEDIEKAKNNEYEQEKALKRSNLDQEEKKKIKKELKETRDKLKEYQVKLQTLDFLDSDKIPADENGGPLLGGGLVITTFEDFLEDVYPSDAPKHELDIIAHAEAVWKVITDFDLDLDRLTVKTPRLIGGGEYVDFDPDEARKISGALRSAFYYLFGDYKRKLKEREYEELKKNYQEPQRSDFDNDEEYDTAIKHWKHEYRHRGAPIRTHEREPGSNVLELDSEGNPKVSYAELFVNQLYNLSLNYDERVNLGLFTPREADWYRQDHGRVFGAEDQQLAWQKIAVEKLIMAVIKAYDESKDKQFTAEHFQALVESMSYTTYKSNRQGINTVLLRKRAGAYGILKGQGETYQGAGPWRRDEVINMVRSILGERAYYVPKDKS